MTDLGFDEGGVLQALATPILQHEVETTRTTKAGKVKVTKTKYELTGAQVIVLMLGPAFLSLFLKFKDMSDEDKQFAKDLSLFGPFTAYTLKKIRETELDDPRKKVGYFSKTKGPLTKEEFDAIRN